MSLRLISDDRKPRRLRRRISSRFAWLLAAALAGAWTAPAFAQRVVATITVGNAPAALAVNPATNTLYVANRSDDTISVVDALDDLVTGTVHDDNSVTPSVATLPTEIAVDPGTNQVYVTNWATCTAPAPGIHEVLQIDGSSLLATPLGTGGSGPTGIAVDPLTHVVYVANICDGTLSLLAPNTSFYPLLANQTGASMPNSIAIDPGTDEIYFANYAHGSSGLVIQWSGATRAFRTLTAGRGPSALVVNPVTHLIYAANQTDGTVTVIDGTTFSVVTTVTVGALPMQLVVDPVTDKVYVVNQNGNSVSVIDGATNAVTTIPVGGGPGGIALDANANAIYVTNTTDGTVSVIDGASQSVTQTLTVGAGPTAIAVNPVTHHVYVANRQTNTISDIDANAAPTVASVAVGNIPRGAALDPLTGRVFVANQGDGTVTAIGPQSMNATSTSAAITPPGVTTLIVESAATGRVAVIDAGTGAGPANVSLLDAGSLALLSTVASLPAPATAAAFDDASGYLYVVTAGATGANGMITAIDPATPDQSLGVPVGQGPVALAIDSATGTAYVANGVSGSVTALAVSGMTFASGATIPVTGQPVGIAVNAANDRVYVISQNGSAPGVLSVIDPSTNTVSTTIPVGVKPSAVAVNPVTDEIFVANQGDGTVTRVDALAGNQVTTIANVGANPHALAIDALDDLVYVADDVNGDGKTAAVTVLDAAAGSVSPPIPTGTFNAELLVNPTTAEVYAPDGAGHVTTLVPATSPMMPVTVSLSGVSDAMTLSTTPFVTTSASPSFQANAVSAFTGLTAYQGLTAAGNPPVSALYTQIDGASGAWSAHVPSSSAGTFAVGTATRPGMHVLYAMAAYGHEGVYETTGNGSGNSPMLGPIGAIPFLVAAGPVPPANAPCASPCVIQSNLGPITVSASQGAVGAVQAAAAPPGAPAAIQTPFGYYTFSVGGLTPGATITVNFAVPYGFTVTGYEKCINGACSALPGLTINNSASGGPTLSLTLTDGGLNDADGVANGTIVDPGAILASGTATTPVVPMGISATAGNGQVTLTWTATAATQSYDVFEGTSAGGEAATPVQTGVTATTTSIAGLTNGSTYYFRIAAVNGNVVSAQSTEVSATPNAPPVQVVGLTASAGDGQVSLAWTAVSGASSYTIGQGTNTGGESAVASGVTAANYTATGLINGTTYYFTVTAVNSAGSGAASTEASATPMKPVTVSGGHSGGGAIDPSVLATLAALVALRFLIRVRPRHRVTQAAGCKARSGYRFRSAARQSSESRRS